MPTEMVEPTNENPAPQTARAADGSDVAALAERLEHLESEHRRLRRDAFLLAAVTTLVSLFVASLLLQKSTAVSKEPSQVVSRRFVEAQAFVLKDPQGHVRARLTVE